MKEWKAWPFGSYIALAMTESCEVVTFIQFILYITVHKHSSMCLHFQGVKVFGNGLIKAFKGYGKIMGHVISPENPPEKFFAPVTHAALLIQPDPSQEKKNIIANNIDGLEDEILAEISSNLMVDISFK